MDEIWCVLTLEALTAAIMICSCWGSSQRLSQPTSGWLSFVPSRFQCLHNARRLLMQALLVTLLHQQQIKLLQMALSFQICHQHHHHLHLLSRKHPDPKLYQNHRPIGLGVCRDPALSKVIHGYCCAYTYFQFNLHSTNSKEIEYSLIYLTRQILYFLLDIQCCLAAIDQKRVFSFLVLYSTLFRSIRCKCLIGVANKILKVWILYILKRSYKGIH